MLLGRMQEDCKYYLGYGSRNGGHLPSWKRQNAYSETKKLHVSFPEGEKPEWLTYDQILEYEKKMKEES
nr:LPD11 domain-containing protein [Paenibacillus sp. Y412MC10]